ncbi:MAG TPA: DHH family phosphoesterase, partial [Pseudonocardiaceae bacterium]|nr:DHH family phosphoesterase [Pseudonocardiaceae bacterium]
MSIATDMPNTYGEAELRAAVALLADARDVTVLGHLNPDPDAFGSMVALGLALRQLGATVRVSFGSPDALPPSLAVLDPGDLYVPASELPKDAPGLLVTVDCASLGRLDGLDELPKATV